MTTYNIVYKGNILEGHDLADVKARLTKEFGISREKADQVLNSGRVIIKKNLETDAAKAYGMALKKAGLHVVLTRCAPPEASPEPPPAGPEDNPPSQPPPKPQVETPPPAPEAGSEPIVKTVSKKYLPFEFSGSGTEYFKIWIVNLILSIITLGIYSAWAKVRRKQYIYGNTSLNGSGFEYLADPVNILKGRIVVAVFFVIYSVISRFFPLAGTIISFLFLAILPWLVVRALTFNARNSAYKNIRFGFNGSVTEAFKAYVLFPLLMPLTLGLLAPYVYFRQKKFIVENSSYGTSPFIFTADHKDYYGLFLRAMFPLVTGIILVVIAAFILPPVSALIGVVFYLYLFAYISVNSTNLLFNSTLLDRHGFDADLETKDYLILITGNTLASVITLGIFYPWAQIRTIRYKLDHLALEAKGDLDSFIGREQKQVSALGDEAGDFFDLDIGL